MVQFKTYHNPNFSQVGESMGDRVRKRLLGRIRLFVRDYNPTKFSPTSDVRVDL